MVRWGEKKEEKITCKTDDGMEQERVEGENINNWSK